MSLRDTSVDNKAEITMPAQIAFRIAQGHIAKCWGLYDDGEGMPMRQKLHEMERSLYFGIAHLVMASQDYDGSVHIQSDGVPEQMSFFWIHKKSNYHGGLIFHRTHIDGKPTELGSWSIHT